MAIISLEVRSVVTSEFFYGEIPQVQQPLIQIGTVFTFQK